MLFQNILNAVLFAIVISAGGTGDELSIVGFVLLCSGLFSLPGLFIFWILFSHSILVAPVVEDLS